MVVVHNYASDNLNQPNDREEVDEDKAYITGIWVFSVFVALILIVFVSFSIIRNREGGQVANKKSSAQVLGEKTAKTSPQKNSQENLSPNQKNNDAEISKENKAILVLERPLTNDEIEAKTKLIPGSQVYEVGAGENLYTIGNKYSVDWRDIARLSNLAAPYSLHVGQKLIIPKGEESTNENKN